MKEPKRPLTRLEFVLIVLQLVLLALLTMAALSIPPAP